MGVDPVQLQEEHPQVFDPLAHFQPQEHLDPLGVGGGVGDGAQSANPGHHVTHLLELVGGGAGPFHAPVDVPHVGVDVDDGFVFGGELEPDRFGQGHVLGTEGDVEGLGHGFFLRGVVAPSSSRKRPEGVQP